MTFPDGTCYSISRNLNLKDNAIPLTYWTVSPNFGDLLSPYLVGKMTGFPVKSVPIKPGHGRRVLRFRSDTFSYLAIGSIISRANGKSVVRGSEALDAKTKSSFIVQATFQAVRGPLTRNLLRIYGIRCPAVYGDPALLLPLVLNPVVEKKFKVGIILRWAEKDWNEIPVNDDVKKIYLGTDNVENTLVEILSCERIVSSSLLN